MLRKLDLRTGTPVWQAYRVPKVPTARLTKDLSCDVLIAGMGISGALMAETLTARGLSVIAVDRRRPLAGSTSATTALVQNEIDQPLTKLMPLIGADAAKRAWKRSRLSVVNLLGRITDLGIACDLAPRPSLYLSGNMLSPSDLKIEAEARRAIGIDCRYLDRDEVKREFGIGRPGALLSQSNLALDPRKLTSGLLRIAAGRGARFFSDTEIVSVESARDRVTASTGSGPSISCKHMVLATGYELLLPPKGAPHSMISTWAIATKPQPKAMLPRQPFIWEASDPYLYLRSTPDGRIICGGEDEEFTDEDKRDQLIAEKVEAIRRKLRRLLPDIDDEPDYAWAGSFGTTPTGLPFIGALPGKPRITAVMGYGGNGITYAQLASEIISASLSGSAADEDADLFAFGRDARGSGASL